MPEMTKTELEIGVMNDIARHIGEYNEDTECEIIRDRAGRVGKLVIRQKIGEHTMIVKLEMVSVDLIE